MKRPKRKTLAQKQAESAAAGKQVVPKDKTRYIPEARSAPPPPSTFENRPFARALGKE